MVTFETFKIKAREIKIDYLKLRVPIPSINIGTKEQLSSFMEGFCRFLYEAGLNVGKV